MTPEPFSFNPLVSPHLENPYPLYARARREAPIFFSPLFATWVVTRYEDVRAILHDPRRFSSSYLFRTPVDPTPEVLAVLAHLPPEVGVLVNEDPPSHRRTRALVGKAFLPRQVARMETRISAIAHPLMVDAALSGNGTVAVLALDRIMEQGEDGVPLISVAALRTGSHEGRDGLGHA
jgi:cytochrome P450